MQLGISSIATQPAGQVAVVLSSWRPYRPFPSWGACGQSAVNLEAVSYSNVGDRERWAMHVFSFQRSAAASPSAMSCEAIRPLRQFGQIHESYSLKSQRSRGVAHGRSGRSVLYDDMDSYVLMEPGRDEQFVTQEELESKLRSWLVKWPANDLPNDLASFESLDDAVSHLVDSACELDLGGGLGSVQWFQIRLES